MLFQVRMDVHIPLNMPVEKPMKLKQLKRLIHKIYNVKGNGVISGVLQANTQTPVILM